MSNDYTADPGSGGSTFRAIDDGTRLWPAGLTAYNSASPTIVDLTHGLPVQAGTSTTWTVVGNVADHATDSGNPVKVAGVYNAFPLSLSDGQRSNLQVDISGSLLVNVSNASAIVGYAGTTGSSVPGSAGYAGLNVAGTLRGATAVNPSGTVYAQQVDLASVAGTTVATGHGTASGAVRVELPTDGTGVVGLAAGSAVIGHVIVDSGTVSTITNVVHVDDNSGSLTVDGTVTANAGTGTFTVQGGAASGASASGNPVQAGGVFNTTQPTVTNGQAVQLQATNRGALIVGTGTDTFHATIDNATLAVTQSGTWNVGTVTTVTGVTTVSTVTSLTQFNGNAIDTNSGVKSAGTLRVVLATDQPQLTNKLLVTPDANSAVNCAQMNGVAVTMGNGVSGTGVQRVTLASDSTGQVAITGTVTVASHAVTNAGTFAVQAACAGDVASGSSDSGNPVKIGGVGKTANPTAVTDGQRVNALFDKLGKQIVVGAVRDLKGMQQTQISSSTSETTIVTAVASTFLDLYGLIIANTSATASKVTIKDSTAGTTRAVIQVPAGETRGFMLPVDSALPQATVNTNWTATCGTSVAAIEITALYVKNI